MIERDLAIRMFSSRNNFTATLVGHLKRHKVFDFFRLNGTDLIDINGSTYQFSTGEGESAEVRQGVKGNVGLIFYSTSNSTLYKYENYELMTDHNHNKTNTSGVKLYTKKALLSVSNIMMHSLAFDKDVYIQECISYTSNTINKIKASK